MNRALLSLVAEGFLMRLGFGIISFTLPLYARHLGLSLTETGALIALTGVVKVALKPATGWLADRVGAKRALVAALGLRSIVAFLFAFASVPWQLYAIRTIHGLSTSVRDPAVNALIAENGDEKAVGSAFAWYFTAKSLAGALGKAMAGVLLTLTASSFSAVFLLTWAISSLTLPAVIFFVPGVNRKRALEQGRESSEVVAADSASPASPGPQQSVYSKAFSVVGLGFLISATASMMDRLYPILATEYAGMTEAQAGAVYLASAVVTLVAGPLFGWMSDRFGRKPIIAVRSLANAGSSLAYLLAPTSLGFTVGKLLDDGGRAGFRPAWGALKADISGLKKSQRAQMMGLMDVGDDAGDVIGPIGGGLLWDAWGIVGLLGSRIALAVLTEVYAAWVIWRPAARPAQILRPGLSVGRTNSTRSRSVENRVVSGTPEGVLFSRRMVRDAEKRQTRRENGKLGGNPLLKFFPLKEVNQRLATQKTPIASSFLASGNGEKEHDAFQPPAHVFVSDEIADKAARFLTRYAVIYAEERRGAHFQIKPGLHFMTACEIVKGWPDLERLELMFRTFCKLPTSEKMAWPGTPAQFLHLAPQIDAHLRKEGV